MNAITNFTGKRNAVITLFLTPASQKLSIYLQKLKRLAAQIKHDNKRGQVLQVLKYITEQTDGVDTVTGNGLIICCGLDNLNKIFYQTLTPPIAITENEYYYDYQFHIQRINEIMDADVIETAHDPDRIVALIKKLGTAEVAIGAPEIDYAIRTRVLQELYVHQDRIVSAELISKIRECRAKIVMCNGIKEYGMVGLLRFPVNLAEQVEN